MCFGNPMEHLWQGLIFQKRMRPYYCSTRKFHLTLKYPAPPVLEFVLPEYFSQKEKKLHLWGKILPSLGNISKHHLVIFEMVHNGYIDRLTFIQPSKAGLCPKNKWKNTWERSTRSIIPKNLWMYFYAFLGWNLALLGCKKGYMWN